MALSGILYPGAVEEGEPCIAPCRAVTGLARAFLTIFAVRFPPRILTIKAWRVYYKNFIVFSVNC
jgi:hypothetical protein